MSLTLNCGTKPEGLSVTTFGTPDQVVFLGEYQITMEDFLGAAHYVLTNSNLVENDPRLQFVKCVQSMQVKKGYLSIIKGKEVATERLVSNVHPFLDE